jgi:hypothetical protein
MVRTLRLRLELVAELSRGWETKSNSAETSAVAVIDVSHPRNPKSVRLLRERGTLYLAETFAAASAPTRKVLDLMPGETRLLARRCRLG